MTTPPTPPNPYDYASPHAPNDTHLWDRTGVARVLGITVSFRTWTALKPEHGTPVRHGNRDFFDLDTILEWDRQQPVRRLDDNGRQRLVIAPDRQPWIDGVPAYTTEMLAEALDMKRPTLDSYIYRKNKNQIPSPDLKYPTDRKPRVYWSQDLYHQILRDRGKE